MMEQILTDFLFKQLPVIVVLGCLCYFMYKYFTKVIDEKDKLIRERDEEIKALHRTVIEMTVKNNELTSKNNEVIGRLRDLIEKIVTSR